jgi:hypothetical protein
MACMYEFGRTKGADSDVINPVFINYHFIPIWLNLDKVGIINLLLTHILR